jgi:hypothetical protein
VASLAKLPSLLKTLHRAAHHYHASYTTILRRFVALYLTPRFSPDEIFEFGLLNPALSSPELRSYVSKYRLVQLQEKLNPPSYTALTEDKSVFYRFCVSAGIAVPQLFAIIEPGFGWATNPMSFAHRRDGERFLEAALPSEFIIKPADGVYGREVYLFERDGIHFVDAARKIHTLSALYDLMCSNPHYRRFVIQERLRNHPEVLRLTSNEFLQTVRMVTLVDKRGVPWVVCCQFRMILGDSLTDNFSSGHKGNLLANICASTGEITAVFKRAAAGVGLDCVSTHPRTGVAFAGARLPLWTDACEMISDAAVKFLPIRTLGWDVALTPKGPIIVEANRTWDTANEGGLQTEFADMYARA